MENNANIDNFFDASFIERILITYGKYLLFFLLLILIIYIAICIFLNALHKKIYARGTVLSFIPICNIYILGKLSFSKITGYILAIFYILLMDFKVTLNGTVKEISIIPKTLKPTLLLVYDIILLILFIVCIFKYFRLKKNNYINKVYLNQEGNNISNRVLDSENVNNDFDSSIKSNIVNNEVSNISASTINTNTTTNNITNDTPLEKVQSFDRTNALNEIINNNNNDNNE